MVNAACKSSRLIGCYQHHPHVIPLPSTTSVKLTGDDEFLVIANAPFWACISHKVAVSRVRNISDSKIAASKLRDLALTHGSKEEISVIVIRFLNSRFVPLYRKSATTKQSDVKASRPKTIHGESSLHYSTASLGRIKHREPVDAENPLQKRAKSIYSVTTQQQPQQPEVIVPSRDYRVDESSQVVMRKTKSDNERHQKALSASPDQVPIQSNELISQSEHKNIHANVTKYVENSKNSLQKVKAVTKKKTAELKRKTGGGEVKDVKKDAHKKVPTTAPVQTVSAQTNKLVSQAKQKSTHANPIKGKSQQADVVTKKKTTELSHKPGELVAKVAKDQHKKTSTPTTNNKQVMQPKTAHIHPTSSPSKDNYKSMDLDVIKIKQTQPQNKDKQHDTNHVNNLHKPVAPDITPPTNNEPVVHSQHQSVHAAATSYDDRLIPTKPPADSNDEQSSFNALHHSSSDSLADNSWLNQSMDATWFDSMPPLQLDGFDTFGLELGMMSDMETNSSKPTDNVVFGGQKNWGAEKHEQQPVSSVADEELEEAKANFNFDELIAGLNNTWMTTLQSISNTTTDTSPNVNTATTTTKSMKRDDSILSASLMAQFEQPSVEEDDEELDNLISQLNEFVDDPF